MMPEQLTFWLELFSVFGGVLGTATAGLAWIMRQALVTHRTLTSALEPLGTQVDNHETRLITMESSVSHLPGAADWMDMRERMVGIETGQEGIRESIGGLKETMERIERPLNVLIDSKLKGQAR